MDDQTRKEMRDYAWKYFDRHAEQRLKTFNFYLLLCAAILAGLFAVLKDERSEWLGICLLLLLTIISLIFRKLDNRTRFLTKQSEEALKTIESEMDLEDEPGGAPHRCKVFLREKYEQAQCGPQDWSYTTCFACIFALFGFGGVIFAGLLANKIYNPSKESKQLPQVQIINKARP